MIVDVTSCRVQSGLTLWLTFSDGTSGAADLTAVAKDRYHPLTDATVFATARVFLTAVWWGDDLNIGTESLYALVHGFPCPTTFDEAEAQVAAVAAR